MGALALFPILTPSKSFRVLTNNFDPEYGKLRRWYSHVVSKAGNGGYHGSVFEFFRNTALDGPRLLRSHSFGYKQNQFGGTIGGPIKRSKSFSSPTTRRPAPRKVSLLVTSPCQQSCSETELSTTSPAQSADLILLLCSRSS